MGILRLSHVEVRVPDLELATAYYTEVVGLYETAREQDRVFLKCWDGRFATAKISTITRTGSQRRVWTSFATRRARSALVTAKRFDSRCRVGT